MSKSYKVIAVGGGPAGISTAIECIEAGLSAEDVLVLEKGPNAIEAIRKFYPDKKMTLANYKGLPTNTLGHIPVFPDLTKAQTIEYFDLLIAKYRVQMRYQSEVFKIQKVSEGFEVLVGRETYRTQVVTVGIGILGRPNKPAYKLPNSLRDHLLFDLTSQKVEGQKVLVVGGGDTSSEYCQVLESERNQVTLVCRGSDLSRMMESNRQAVEQLSGANKMKLFRSMEVREVQDVGGKPHILFSDETRLPAETFDKVIFALGGTTPLNFLNSIGVECEAQWPKYSDSGATNIPNLYLTGDLVCGKLGGSIITAYNSSFKSVQDFKSRVA